VSVLLELLFWSMAVTVRKRHSWFITYVDEHPTIDLDGISKFIDKGYDPELGWVRKPNTSGVDVSQGYTTEWNINSIGARRNPGFDGKDALICTYGDSFVFARQVGDDKSWAHKLSILSTTNVLNFGVGNYGLDQALMRLMREYEKNKTKVVIVGVVPETICRVRSYWKHYFEYGNTLGLKPVFKVADRNIELVPNIADVPDKLGRIGEFLRDIQANDYFYEKKFKKEIVRFPYIYHWLKNPKLNFTKALEAFSGLDLRTPPPSVMDNNLKWRVEMYKDDNSLFVLDGLIGMLKEFSLSKGFVPIFVFLPQKDDVLFIKENDHYYKGFIQSVAGKYDMDMVDLYDAIAVYDDIDELYSDQTKYGGHYSDRGNEIVAETIYKFIKGKELL